MYEGYCQTVEFFVGDYQETMYLKCISPSTPLLYRKLGFAGVYLFFLFLFQNIDSGYSLEPPTINVLSKDIKVIKNISNAIVNF